jgi:hypothetical protein
VLHFSKVETIPLQYVFGKYASLYVYFHKHFSLLNVAVCTETMERSLMNQLPHICLRVLCFPFQLSGCSVHGNIGDDNHLLIYVSDKYSGLVILGQWSEGHYMEQLQRLKVPECEPSPPFYKSSFSDDIMVIKTPNS